MTYFKAGTWNVVCQVCGFQHKSDEIRKRWDGLLVCKDDWEPRHSLDFIKTRPERAGVPYSAPEPTDVFVGVSCPFPTAGGMADVGTADCAIADYYVAVPASVTLAIAEIAISSTCTPY